MSNEVTITFESPASDDSLSLLSQLTSELTARYGDDGGANSFNPHEASGDGSAFLVARFHGRPVGCGAIRLLEPGVAEVKRMFVLPSERGSGLARRILSELEATARKFGYKRIRLETGLKQPEAVGLYESAGYHRVPCYGEYVRNPLSVCFEKALN